MKPQSQISRQLRAHRGEEMQPESRPKDPAIDWHYHPAGDLRGANRRVKFSARPVGSFRDLSNEFLGTEMKRDYVTEALCFLIIVSTSAWPIVSMVRALSLLK